MRIRTNQFVTLVVLGAGVALGMYFGRTGVSLIETAEAQPGSGSPMPVKTSQMKPTGTITDPYMYYPGTEALGPDEMRVIACGTGMPSARRGQAASCFLVELGNGDKFLFDLGSGSMRNVMALNIPADFLTKIFLSHLHTDHWADLPGLWAGGWTGGRTRPLEVWGPSGAREDMGTKYAIEHFMRTYNWDYVTRAVKVSSVPGSIMVHEFDYRGINEVIYEENGVTVRSIPAVHAGDGPVSLILEWNGYKFVYGGDTAPNKWFVDHCKDADFILQECMMTPEQFMKFYGMPAGRALMMQWDIHTSAQSCGKIFSELKPRHAAAFHFFNEEGTRYDIYAALRQTYDGPLSLADDLMVWNITREEITERMAVPVDNAWDVAGPTRPPAPDGKFPPQESEFILSGRWQPAVELDNEVFRPFREKHGLPDMMKK